MVEMGALDMSRKKQRVSNTDASPIVNVSDVSSARVSDVDESVMTRHSRRNVTSLSSLTEVPPEQLVLSAQILPSSSNEAMVGFTVSVSVLLFLL